MPIIPKYSEFSPDSIMYLKYSLILDVNTIFFEINKLENLTWLVSRIILNKNKSEITIRGGGMSKKLILSANMLGLESQRLIEI